MNDAETASVNGDAELFDIDAIIDLIVPFEFEFEGHKLKGHWFKYKTTTPEWAQQRVDRYTLRLERLVEIQKEINQTKDTTLILKRNQERTQIEQEAQRALYDWIADAIVDWTAVRRDKTPIPVEEIRTKGFPIPFMVKLGQHLEADRNGENPTLPTSPIGS